MTDIKSNASKVTAATIDSNKLKTLNKFGKDLTRKYRESDDFPPILERESETRDLLSILVQKFKNNAILVGEAGTGKTAIVEGLAQALAIGNVPDAIKGFSLWELDLPKLSNKDESDGGYRFRIQNIVQEVVEAGNIILFVDETHSILDKKSDLDVGDLLKPSLARGELRMIGSTTDIEFHTYIEQDKALVRRFQRVTVQELGRDSVVRILKSRKRSLEVFHGVTISSGAIEAAVDLGLRYLPSRRNPDKSIDILDKACAMTRLEIDSMPKELTILQGEIFVLEKDLELEGDPVKKNDIEQELVLKKPIFEEQVAVWQEQKEMLEWIRGIRSNLMTVENSLAVEESKKERADAKKISQLSEAQVSLESDLEKYKSIYYHQSNLMIRDDVNVGQVQKTIEATTGIPVSEIGRSEIERLRRLDGQLSQRVIGQPQAIKAVTYSIKRSRLGISSPKQPIGTFIFLGPSGVGKSLKNSELIPTPDRGMVALERIAVGDEVFNKDGKPVKVIGVFPQGKRRFYSVNLEDGRKLSADSEHLFSFVRDRKKVTEFETETVSEIKTELESDGEVEFFIPNNKAVEFENNRLSDLESLYFAVGRRTTRVTSALKTTSLKQRQDILRGAFDIYGSIEGQRVVFQAPLKDELVSDIKEILLSTGVGYINIDDYSFEVKYSDRDEVFNLFGTKEKRDLVYVKIPRTSPYKDQLDFVKVISITEEPSVEEATCILVDDDEHLFLASKEYVVTHNTELVKALAETMFGDETAMKRFDCGEFKSKKSVSRLIGAPPGEGDDLDSGGEMTEYVKKNPYSVLLFDEAEKADPAIWDVLLSVFDDGEVADSRGEVVNFRNTIIILTSNIAAFDVLRGQDKVTGELPENVMNNIHAKLKNADPERGGKGFRPEFVNRISNIVIFFKLMRPQLETIANLKLRGLKRRLKESRNISLVFSKKTFEVYKDGPGMKPELDVAYLLSSAWMLSEQDLDLGGRPIDRLIAKEIENRLTDLLLDEEVPDGSFIYIQAGYGSGMKVRKDQDGITRPVSPQIIISVISEAEYQQLIVDDPVEHLFDKKPKNSGEIVKEIISEKK